MNNDPYEDPNNRRSTNPNDQPLMVPKRFGYGYSFNWSNPRAVLLFLVLIGVVILIAVLLPLLLMHH
jgi:uncharacterized membrane protein